VSVTPGSSPFDRMPPAVRHRPPRDCPVCSQRLDVTQLGCPSCGTGLTGRFQPCEFCGLDDADREVLRVFLASRGNMKELERHLGVSYPTARARFDDLLRKLDLGGPVAARDGTAGRSEARSEAATGGPGAAGRSEARSEAANGHAGDPTDPGGFDEVADEVPSGGGGSGRAKARGSRGTGADARLDTLRALASGDLDVQAARQRLVSDDD